MSKRAVVIGSGFGGIALALRLQSLGLNTTIVEKLDKPGGRAYVLEAEGFKFDMGPTVITVPHFIEELFSLERGKSDLELDDFPKHLLEDNVRIKQGVSGGPNTSKYCEIVPILPFYRIYFDDGTYFDYDGDPVNTRKQIAEIEPKDLEGYERFHAAAEKIFERGFLELGYTYFSDIPSMLKVAPELFRLDAVRSLFSFTSKYFISPKLRQVFSFETLLVGGNPLKVPAIYSMIHFVEKTWGIHYVKGGTGALVSALLKKFSELGGQIRYNSEVEKITTEKDSWLTKAKVTGVRLKDGTVLESDMVCSNADFAHTYLDLIDKKHRTVPKWRIKSMKYSMSLVVIYFGFKKRDSLDLQHHNIILGPRYEELLTDIFERKVLAKDFSQYLHIPTLTDPSMAPEGHHAAYTLIPVPHNGSKIDWESKGPQLVDAVLSFLDDRGYIPNLKEDLVYSTHVDPHYFENTLNSFKGNAFGVEPTLTQSAYFRPQNRSKIDGLYLVGANSQPGAGTPSVMMSAKMTARAIAQDLKQTSSNKISQSISATELHRELNKV
ncbi:MAG: phytoene dehydrogenase [Deltaproteobacteria bacterium]|nr:phytoene dehydrogenase [Deltaproteobacteria bacterium]